MKAPPQDHTAANAPLSETVPVTSSNVVTVTGPRLPCAYCDKDFARQFTLKRHMQVHAEISPYQCPHCQDRFRREDVRARHILEKHTETGDRAECELCKRVVVRRYLKHHRGGLMCQKGQQCASRAKVSSSRSKNVNDKLTSISGEPPFRIQLRFLPMDVFWRYADILICSDYDAELVRRGTLCAGSYVMFLYLQGDRSARVHVRLGLTYATLWNACERLKRAMPWPWAWHASVAEPVAIAQLRRQILFTMNILALIDFQLGKAEAAQQHWHAFAAMGGNELNLMGLEDLAVADANAVVWAMALADREKAVRDEERMGSFSEFLTAGQKTGAFSVAYQEAMVKYASKILILRATSPEQ